MWRTGARRCLIDPGSSQTRTKCTPSIGVLTDLPKPPQTVVALVPNVGSVGRHRDALAKKPFCPRNAAVTGRHGSLAVTMKNFSLHSINSHPAVQTVSLAGLIRSAGPAAPYLVEEKVEVSIRAPRTVYRGRPSPSRTSP